MIWGTLTADEIQPIIDGLALDESLLGGVIAGTIAVAAAKILSPDRVQRGRLAA